MIHDETAMPARVKTQAPTFAADGDRAARRLHREGLANAAALVSTRPAATRKNG